MSQIFPIQLPSQKPFALNSQADEKPINYEEWWKYIAEAIHRFNFGPDIGPLRIIGSSKDEFNLRTMQIKLQELGWVVFLNIAFSSIMEIYHPADPEIPHY